MAKKRKATGAIVFIVLIILVAVFCGGLYKFKKTYIDYEGKYGTDKLVYIKDYGLTILLNYNYDYIVNEVKGYAIVNIPLKSFFTNKRVYANNSGYDCADSDSLYDDYAFKARILDNNLMNTLSEALTGNSTRSVSVGKYGNYFIKTAKEMGYMPVEKEK